MSPVMEQTPKLKRKSLSFAGRFNSNKNKNSMSPVQLSRKSSLGSGSLTDTPRSPSVISLSPDGGVEFTPPHKKFSLDDSIDISPKTLDSSFSPSCLLSQTLAAGSPEVGWRWTKRAPRTAEDGSSTTPDSAYSGESSFTSAGSNSTEAISGRTRSENQRQKQRLEYNLRKEKQRRAMEIEMRRAEKSRLDKMLKMRCAKFQEQLNDAQSQRKKDRDENNSSVDVKPPKAKVNAKPQNYDIPAEAKENKEPIKEKGKGDTFEDFFNDSDSDCFLVEATQQLETKMVELTKNVPEPMKASTVTATNPPNGSSTTSTSGDKEKRSSLYMKFLEDDSPDDWFQSLDEIIREASQSTKPRTAFQRHRSMPVETASVTDNTAKVMTTTTTTTTTSAATHNPPSKNGTTATDAQSATKIKRHASSHSFGTAVNNTNRERRGFLRK